MSLLAREYELRNEKIPEPYFKGDFDIFINLKDFPQEERDEYRRTKKLKTCPTVFPKVKGYIPLCETSDGKIEYMLKWNEERFYDFCDGFFEIGREKAKQFIDAMMTDHKNENGFSYKALTTYDALKLVAVVSAFGKRFFDENWFMPTPRKEVFVVVSASTKRDAANKFFEKGFEKTRLFQLDPDKIYKTLDDYFEAHLKPGRITLVDQMYSLFRGFDKDCFSLESSKLTNADQGMGGKG